MYKLAVFDLDGTVLDTLDDLALAFNAARAHAGLKPQDKECFRRWVVNGSRRTIELSTEGETADREEMLSFFREYYLEHCLENTYEYEGITELLTELKASGVHTAVYTNKPDNAAQKLIKARFDGLFDITRGQREGLPIKPDPGILISIMSDFGVKASETVYIGDSEVDIMTGKNAGVRTISVSWGFKSIGFLLSHGAQTIVGDSVKLTDMILDRG